MHICTLHPDEQPAKDGGATQCLEQHVIMATVKTRHESARIESAVAAHVLKMVLYFDVFQHPLTRSELERFVAPQDTAGVEDAIGDLVAKGLLETRGAYCFRAGRGAMVTRRQDRGAHAERAWPHARRAAACLAQVPFVRGVLVTGGMSKNSTAPGGDVDFMLLVEPGRVWTLKTLLQTSRRMMPPAIREWFCTNYLLSTDTLEIDDQNLFTAVELATAIPVVGRRACSALLDANRWADQFVPGMDWSRERAAHALERSESPLQRMSEALIDSGGLRVEGLAMKWWNWYWNRKYDWLDDADRTQRFKRREEIATNHLHDFQDYVLGEVLARYQTAGVDAPPMVIG